MEEIARRSQSSKATLYNYFDSKEVLFFEVMFEATRAEFEQTHALLDLGRSDWRECLGEFAAGLLSFVYSQKVMEARRLAMREAKRAGIGEMCEARGRARSLAAICEYMAGLMERKALRPGDARLAAKQFSGLLECELCDGLWYGKPAPGEQAAKECAQRAAQAFIRLWGNGA